MLEDMDRNRKSISSEIGTLVFYMQGGLDYDTAHLLSADQRSVLSKVIEKHYTSASGKNNNKLI